MTKQQFTRWRVGRKVGRTVYGQVGDTASDDDVLIGVLDSPYLAAMAVEAVNFWIDALHKEASGVSGGGP